MQDFIKQLNYSLHELLEELTKEELLDLCREEGITKVSRLRKADLIAEMSELLPEIIRNKMLFWDQSLYDFMKDMADGVPVSVLDIDIADSWTTLGEPHFPGELADDENVDCQEDLEKLEDLAEELPELEALCLADSNIGFAFSVSTSEFDLDYLIMPQDYIDIFLSFDSADYQKRVEKNTKIIRLTKGLLYHYGLFPCTILNDQLEALLGIKIGLDYLESLFETVNVYTWGFYQAADYVIDGQVSDALLLLKEQNNRALPYRELNYSEVWEAGKKDFIADTPQKRALVDFINNISPQHRGEEFPLAVYIAAQLNEPPYEYIAALCAGLGLKSKKTVLKFTDLFLECFNTIPQWVLRGHTLQEATKISLEESVAKQTGKVYNLATKTKVGRNDPCPCGSGKKFKRCCGN